MTLHLLKEQEAANILNIPYETVTRVALIPTAYTLGGEFKPGAHKTVEQIRHADSR